MEKKISVASNDNSASSIFPERRPNSQIIEEGPRVCPLCASEVRLFFINLNEKLLMCENTECDFPFGYEELQFVRVKESEEVSDIVSAQSQPQKTRSRQTASSVISTISSVDLEKFAKDEESEDLEPTMLNGMQHMSNPKNMNRKIQSKCHDHEKLIKKNLEDLKGLTIELSDMTSSSRNIIKNEKWIKNLMQLQDQSGVKLLKPQELKELNKTVEQNQQRELKIDIGPGNSSCLSSIKIEIAKKACPKKSEVVT